MLYKIKTVLHRLKEEDGHCFLHSFNILSFFSLCQWNWTYIYALNTLEILETENLDVLLIFASTFVPLVMIIYKIIYKYTEWHKSLHALKKSCLVHASYRKSSGNRNRNMYENLTNATTPTGYASRTFTIKL